MPITKGSQTGTVFELHTARQILIESNFRSKQLQNAGQELFLENLSAGSKIKLGNSVQGLAKQELVTSGSCLFLKPGIYRWSQQVMWDSLAQPDYLRYDRDVPRAIDNFGTGTLNRQFVNTGAGTIVTTMSGEAGRWLYLRGWVKYDLLAGEDLTAQVVVKDLSTGIPLFTGKTEITGPDTDELDTGVWPYQLKAGVLYEASLIVQTNASKKPYCRLVHQEKP